MLPLAYSLLPDKSRATYRQTDYEAAAISALRFVFPAIVINGCFFHFSQAIWPKCQALGLTVEYRDNSTVHKVVHNFALCREEDISQVRASCLAMSQENPLLINFMQYMLYFLIAYEL
ncbi:unnamed protein product, partial [Gordionus sp. m RMFG-2023]